MIPCLIDNLACCEAMDVLGLSSAKSPHYCQIKLLINFPAWQSLFPYPTLHALLSQPYLLANGSIDIRSLASSSPTIVLNLSELSVWNS